jgi:hypothetical protein
LTGRRHGFGAVALATLAAGGVCLGATGCSNSAALGPKGLAIYETTISARTARVWVYLNVQAPRATTYVLAEGETNLSSGACALGVQAAGVTTNELFTGSDLYFQVPQGARATSGGRPWAEVVFGSSPRSGPEAAAGSALTGSELTDVDPAPLLGVLATQAERSVFVGPGMVGGRPASEYRLDLRTAALVTPALGGDGKTNGGVISLIAGLPHPGKAVLAVYVWLDRQGRAVQIATSATLETEPADPSGLQAALANQLPATVSVRVDLRNFGVRFSIQPPPVGEVSRVPVSQLEAGVL